MKREKVLILLVSLVAMSILVFRIYSDWTRFETPGGPPLPEPSKKVEGDPSKSEHRIVFMGEICPSCPESSAEEEARWKRLALIASQSDLVVSSLARPQCVSNTGEEDGRRCPPVDPNKEAAVIKSFGIDAINLTAICAGGQSAARLNETKAALSRAGIRWFGADAGATPEAPGHFAYKAKLFGRDFELAVFGAPHGKKRLAPTIKRLKELKRRNPRALAVSYQNRSSTEEEPTKADRSGAERLLRAGADLVLGNGASEELLQKKNKWILEGLGSALNGYLEVAIRLEKGKPTRSLRLFPLSRDAGESRDARSDLKVLSEVYWRLLSEPDTPRDRGRLKKKIFPRQHSDRRFISLETI